MASCCRRYRARRLKALGHDPQLLVIRPAPPATSLDHLKPFKLSTALMAVHKDCYAPIGLIQQGGPRRRETLSGNGRCSALASSHGARSQTSRSSSVNRMTGMAFGWIGCTTAVGDVVRKPYTLCGPGI